MSKLIVIIGVTGLQGSSVATTFLALPGWKVRGVTRNPSGEAAIALETKGVEIVKGDIDDVQSLISAFEGAAVIFANTDYFTHLYSSLASGAQDKTPDELNQHAYMREVEQNVNIAEAAASPAVIETLERFVLSSLSDARKLSGGKFTNVYHFDSKAEAIRTIHTRFHKVAERMSTVQLGHYVTNWKAIPRMAPQKQPDGSFLTYRPYGPDVVLPFVVPNKDTGAFVKALTDLPAGKDLLGVSQSMTFPEWMKLWGDIHGVTGGFKQESMEEHFDGIPTAAAQEIGAAYDYMAEFGYTGRDPNVLTPDQLPIKPQLTSMEEYIRSEDWSSVLNS